VTVAASVVSVVNGCGGRTRDGASRSPAAQATSSTATASFSSSETPWDGGAAASSRSSASSSISSTSASGASDLANLPPSCQPGGPGMTNCGPAGSGNESCCTSLEVPGGTYYRTYDPVDEDGGVLLAADGGATGLADPATVSGFRLDKYLVTVGRFRQYVNYVTSTTGAPPANGSGIHTHLNGGLGLANSASPGTHETGWDATDWDDDIETGPSEAGTWDEYLSCTANTVQPTDDGTWTSTPGAQENLPITCVLWQWAYAFCIWDGGFLPSEAEWGYAAAAGNQQREYPWGSADPGTGNQYAIQDLSAFPTGLASVGMAPLGAAYWGQLDMAGEVAEWVLDALAVVDAGRGASEGAPYFNPCTNCAYLETGPLFGFQRTRGGSVSLFSAARIDTPPPNVSQPSIGFRCARTP
jgi:formylglycine-generating enzyme required for sulfatase activity